ncbi:MAG: DUF3857 domain-containing protein [Leeuwenhoekiella sp.]
MIIKKSCLAFITLALWAFCYGHAQEPDLGNVSKKDLLMTAYGLDPSAPAVVLQRYRKSYYDHNEDGWLIVTEHHERIKILTQEGMEYATKKVLAYIKNEDEDLSRIIGYTHYLKDGKPQKVKLKKDGIFENKASEKWMEYSWTMPNAGVGTVVEWVYTTKSPYWTQMDDVVFQDDIPVASYYAEIRMPQFMKFRTIKKGYFDLEPEFKMEKRRASISFSQDSNYGSTSRGGQMTITELVGRFALQDVPALKKEPLVDNIDNYRYSVAFDLESYYSSAKGKTIKLSTTWDEVANTIFENKRFGKRLEELDFLESRAKLLIEEHKDAPERMRAAFNHIQRSMAWNGDYGKFAEHELEDSYEDKVGSVAEINLILIGLLQKSGLEVYPVLLSTRHAGFPVFPTIDGFNYVIAAVKINGEYMLLDATDKLSVPNVLPTRVYNWEGRLVKKYGTSEPIELYTKKPTQENIMLSGEITENGEVIGDIKHRFTEFKAWQYRKSHGGDGIDDRIASVADENGIDEVFDLEVTGLENLDDAIVESFNFELFDAYDQAGGTIYFKPLLFLGHVSNPFAAEERNYPVNFIHPFIKTISAKYKIPEGFTVSSLPEPTSMSLPDNLGTFRYMVRFTGDYISVDCRFEVSEASIPPHQYLSLKKFYEKMVDKEREKVVLSKI